MFDLIAGLPIHALAVHAAVVLLPLTAIGTVAATGVERWRPALRWWVIADAVMVVVAFATKESGEQLQDRLKQVSGEVVAHDHGEMGELVPLFAVVLVVAAVIAYVLVGRLAVGEPVPGRRRGAAVALVGLAATATIAWTAAVGHSGASSVWSDQVTKSPVTMQGQH